MSHQNNNNNSNTNNIQQQEDSAFEVRNTNNTTKNTTNINNNNIQMPNVVQVHRDDSDQPLYSDTDNDGSRNSHQQQKDAQDEKLFTQLASKGAIHTYRPLEFIFGGAVLLIGFIIGSKVTPYCRPFLWTDASISNAYKPNTFPSYSLVIMCICAVVLMALIVFKAPQFSLIKSSVTSASSLRGAEIVSVSLYFLHALAINEIITGPLKVYDGRLRPDFLSRLESLGYSAANTTVDWCQVTREQPLIHRGRLSFPSGHSSTSFVCCTALSLYLLSRLRAYSINDSLANNWLLGKRLPVFKNGVIRFFVGSLPMILCFIVAASRTRDDRHHHADILAGAVIGFLSAVTSWNMHFVHVNEAKMQILFSNHHHAAAVGCDTKKTDDAVGETNDVVSSTTKAVPWYLRDDNRDSVGDHIPRWFLSAI